MQDDFLINVKQPDFGKRMNLLREEEKISIDEFSRLVEISPRNVFLIEKGILNISIPQYALAKIASVLDVCIESLLMEGRD